MTTRCFTLIVPAVLDDDEADAVYGVCPDATIASREGSTFLHFDRDADSLEGAIRSALRDATGALVRAGSPARVVRVEFESSEVAEAVPA